MTDDECQLLLALASAATDKVVNVAEIKDLARRVRGAITPGRTVAIRVEVYKVENGFVYFKGHDDLITYRRLSDVVPE